jgi:hypothetical protein
MNQMLARYCAWTTNLKMAGIDMVSNAVVSGVEAGERGDSEGLVYEGKM